MVDLLPNIRPQFRKQTDHAYDRSKIDKLRRPSTRASRCVPVSVTIFALSRSFTNFPWFKRRAARRTASIRMTATIRAHRRRSPLSLRTTT